MVPSVRYWVVGVYTILDYMVNKNLKYLILLILF